MQFRFDKQNHAIEWSSVLNGAVISWRFVVAPAQLVHENVLKLQLSIALHELTSREEFGKTVKKAEDVDWVVGGYEDARVPMDMDTQSDDEFDSDFDDAEFDNTYTPRRRAELMQEAKSSVKKQQQSKESSHNKMLEVGNFTEKNRTMVVRGSQIGVFKHGADNRLKYVTKIPVIRDLNKEIFSPSKVMLHEQDSKLLLLDEKRPNTVFCMDLNRGEVVEEWRGQQDATQFRDVAPSSKYAQRTPSRVLTGVGSSALFTLDPRLSGTNKIASSKAYARSTRAKLSCLATTGTGQVVVGSDTGQIRMYSAADGKRAKTALPGLGDAVIGLDTTQSGDFILATTGAYLLLVPTKRPSDGATGFKKGMGKEKPAPTKLQLHPEDLVRYNIKQVAFTAAHFNTGEDQRETWICTSTGPYIVLWNFRSILKHGNLYDYRIKKATDTIVGDNFRYGSANEVVVAESDNIYSELRNVKRSGSKKKKKSKY
jgi:hypothetical protein